MADEGKPPLLNFLLHYSTLSLILHAIIIPGTPRIIQYAFVPIIGVICLQLIAKTTTGVVFLDAAVGCMFLMQPMMHFANILLTDPDSLVDYSHPEAEKITEKSWWNRALWTVRLSLNPRGIGWKHEVRHLPGSRCSASTPGWIFVGRTTRRILRNVFIMCLGLAVIVNISALPANDSLSSASIQWRMLVVLSTGLAVRAGMDNVYLTAALCAVAGGFSTPDQWPDMFGSVLDAWSVSRFWSVTWHQMLKRWMTVCATSLTTLLGIHRSPPGICSLIEGVIWLWTVFFLSGLVHIGGEYMATRQLLLNGGIFKFFMLQPIAIILERVLLPRTMGATSTRKGSYPPSIPIRVFGYFWVVLWFTWGFVPVIDVYLPTGIVSMKLLYDLLNVRFEIVWPEFLHGLQRTAVLSVA